MPDIKIAAADGGSFSAYLARPAKTPAPGILLIQEIFGVNKVMRDLADGYARQGYVVACPDLFWRIEPGVQITDKSQAEWDKAFDLMNKFLAAVREGRRRPQATIAHLRRPARLQRQGRRGRLLPRRLARLCLGAHQPGRRDRCFGRLLPGADRRRIFPYAGNIDQARPCSISRRRTASAHPNRKRRSRKRSARTPTARCTAIAGVDHAFAREGGANYNAEAARLANERTAAFFKKNLGLRRALLSW